jgi:hypothetical protein
MRSMAFLREKNPIDSRPYSPAHDAIGVVAGNADLVTLIAAQ